MGEGDRDDFIGTYRPLVKKGYVFREEVTTHPPKAKNIAKNIGLAGRINFSFLHLFII